MDPTEQHSSIDHFEEKFVTYTPVLIRVSQEQDANDSEGVKEDGTEGATREAAVEMENKMDEADEHLQEKSEQSVSSCEPDDGAKEVAREKIEIIMGINQTIDVDVLAGETNHQMNDGNSNPESSQKSELNLFVASETSVDQPLNAAPESEESMIPNELGVLADKEKVVNVDMGWKDDTDDFIMVEHQPNVVVEAPPMVTSDMVQKDSDMQTSTEEIKDVCTKDNEVGTESLNTIFKSEVEKPSDPVVIEAQQASEVASKSEASAAMLVKNPDENVILKEERTVSESAVLQSHPIEVERKFQVTNFDEGILLRNNGKLISDVSFEDVYYDNNSYDLILKDCWLRERNKTWEFKMPVNMDEGIVHMSTQYTELEGEKDIRRALLEIIQPEETFPEDAGIIQEFNLEPFATFTTMRKSYQLTSDCKVVIDLTGFGYSVGEIEIMVKDKSEIAEAVARIDAVANQLGFKMLSVTELAKC